MQSVLSYVCTAQILPLASSSAASLFSCGLVISFVSIVLFMVFSYETERLDWWRPVTASGRTLLPAPKMAAIRTRAIKRRVMLFSLVTSMFYPMG
jgi:hypothetical protein